MARALHYSLSMETTMTPWNETPLWLRGLQCDAEVYQPSLVTMVRRARSGCQVSLTNCRTLHERIMGRA